MKGLITFPSAKELALGQEQTWLALYELLRPSVTLFVYLYAVPSWHGQEHDLIEDVLQETVIRIHRQVQSPSAEVQINNMEAFCRTIARNYCRDLRRKEKRLQPFPEDGYTYDISHTIMDDPVETVFEALFTQTILVAVAQLIASFPEKQRVALLIDLAQQGNNGGTQLSPLEQALATVQINLRSYQGRAPIGPIEKARHSSLVSIAYKRLRNQFFQHYASLVA